MKPILRFWCGRCAYKGLEKFLFGTVQAESELAALRKLEEKWADISPHPFPDSVEVVPGMVIFHEEQREPT